MSEFENIIHVTLSEITNSNHYNGIANVLSINQNDYVSCYVCVESLFARSLFLTENSVKLYIDSLENNLIGANATSVQSSPYVDIFVGSPVTLNAVSSMTWNYKPHYEKWIKISMNVLNNLSTRFTFSTAVEFDYTLSLSFKLVKK